MNDFPNLPKSWQVKTLGEVCDIISKGATPKNQNKTADANSALFLKAENVTQNGCVNFDNVKFIDYKTHTTTLKRSMLKNLDILITIAGSLARCAVLEINPNQQININQAVSFARLKDTSKVNPHFVKYFIMNPAMQLYLLSKAKTTAVPNLTLEIIRDTKIPIPPLEIQRRIVKRLDEAFSRIENGTKHLKSAKDNLTKYKQSLLKSAFNGTLMNDSPLSQGESIAESSLRENPQGFSWQSTHLLSLGESTTKQSINTHPLAPSAREGEQESCHDFKSPLPCGGDLGVGNIRNDDKDSLNGKSANLPQGWTIKTLGEVCEFAYGKGLESARRKTNGKYPVYAANGIKDYSDEYMIKEPSIIVGRKGSVGSLVLTNAPCWVLDVSYYVVFDKEKYDLMFLYHLLKTLNLNQYARGVKPGLSRSQAYELKVKIPPLEIQRQIVAILEKHFTSADKVSAYIESCLSKAKQLKSSLLKSAFAGELV